MRLSRYWGYFRQTYDSDAAGNDSVKCRFEHMMMKRLRAIKRYIAAHLPYGMTEDGYQRWHEKKQEERIAQAWRDTSGFA